MDSVESLPQAKPRGAELPSIKVLEIDADPLIFRSSPTKFFRATVKVAVGEDIEISSIWVSRDDASDYEIDVRGDRLSERLKSTIRDHVRSACIELEVRELNGHLVYLNALNCTADKGVNNECKN